MNLPTTTTKFIMSIIQDKLGNDFLRSNGSMDSNFSPGMIMFSHLPPVTSFTRLATQSVMQDLPGPHEMILKKERDSPDCSMGGLGGYGGVGDYVHAMDIKQEKMTEHDYRLPLYPGGPGKSTELLEVSMGNHQNLLVHDLSLGNVRPSDTSILIGLVSHTHIKPSCGLKSLLNRDSPLK